MLDVKMPQLGETVTEGTITRWFKAPGDTVTVDEPLFEVSTDKVDTEVPAPSSGMLVSISVAEGDTVAVGAVVCSIVAVDELEKENDLFDVEIPQVVMWADDRGDLEYGDVVEHAVVPPPPPVFAAPAGPPALNRPSGGWQMVAPEVPGTVLGSDRHDSVALLRTERTLPQQQEAPEVESPVDTVDIETDRSGPSAADQQKPLLSPVVRALIADHGIDPFLIEGTGPAGRITRQDVMAYIDAATRHATSTSSTSSAHNGFVDQDEVEVSDVFRVQHLVGSGGRTLPDPARVQVSGQVQESSSVPVVEGDSQRSRTAVSAAESGAASVDEVVADAVPDMAVQAMRDSTVQVSPSSCTAQIDVDFTAVVSGLSSVFPTSQHTRSAAVVFAVCEALARHPQHHGGRFTSGRPVVDVRVERFPTGPAAGNVSTIRSAESKLVRALISELAVQTPSVASLPAPCDVVLLVTDSAVVFPTDVTSPTFCVGEVRRTLVYDESAGVAVRFIGRMSLTVPQQACSPAAVVELLAAVRDVLESRRWSAEPA